MRVRLLVSRASVASSHAPGDELEVDRAEALRMIAAGQAVAVESPAERAIPRRRRREVRHVG